VDCDKAVFDSIVENAEVPLCREASGNSTCSAVQYTFKLECVDPCPPDVEPVARRLSKEGEENVASTQAFERAVVNESLTAANEPSGDVHRMAISASLMIGAGADVVGARVVLARAGVENFKSQ
jgi:hypothetical protein